MDVFVIFKDDHTARLDELGKLLKRGDIGITKEEIQGQSRCAVEGALIQTKWFILQYQCIAPRVRHLPITGLELVTLAYTALNFATDAV